MDVMRIIDELEAELGERRGGLFSKKNRYRQMRTANQSHSRSYARCGARSRVCG